jgi:hypothetical protein
VHFAEEKGRVTWYSFMQRNGSGCNFRLEVGFRVGEFETATAAPSPLPPDKILGSGHSKLDVGSGVERRPAVQRNRSATSGWFRVRQINDFHNGFVALTAPS